MDGKKYLLMLTLSALLFIAGYHIGSSPDDASASNQVFDGDIHTSHSDVAYVLLKHKLDLLEQENQELRRVLNDSRQPSLAEYQHPASLPAQSVDSSEILREQFIAEQRVAERARAFHHALSVTAGDYALTEKIAWQFDQEPVDSEWARSSEFAILSLFQHQNSLQYVVPETVLCKTEQCRVRIPVASTEEANQIGQKIGAVLAESHSAGIAKTAVTTMDFALSVVDIYIGKSEQTDLLK